MQLAAAARGEGMSIGDVCNLQGAEEPAEALNP